MLIFNIIPDHPKLVAELIHPNRHWWDVEKIRYLFSQIIASVVLKIPLPNDHRDERRGNYTVRKAYQLINR